MERVTQNPDGSYHWSCSIDKEYHRESGRQGLWAVLIVCAVVLAVFFIVTRGAFPREELWIPLLVIGVVLAVSLPLLFLWYFAADPHEQYVLTEDYVKSGYGKGAVYSEFRKINGAVVTAEYIELLGKYRSSRIYVPPEDMAFIRDYILKRLPDDAEIQYR